MACVVCAHELREEIDAWLRERQSAPQISKHLNERGLPGLASWYVSDHRRNCLKLERLLPGRPNKDEAAKRKRAEAEKKDGKLREAREAREREEAERRDQLAALGMGEGDDLSDIEDTALKLFRWRLKNRPELVGTKDLLPFALSALKRKQERDDEREREERKRDPVDEAVVSALEQLDD